MGRLSCESLLRKQADKRQTYQNALLCQNKRNFSKYLQILANRWLRDTGLGPKLTLISDCLCKVYWVGGAACFFLENKRTSAKTLKMLHLAKIIEISTKICKFC